MKSLREPTTVKVASPDASPMLTSALRLRIGRTCSSPGSAGHSGERADLAAGQQMQVGDFAFGRRDAVVCDTWSRAAAVLAAAL
ncbi:hypothetical protein [Planotetraspora sp. GP83]|uniref:hypothetical protein n=1 Tax=Planotetraspora sp. GP83 TaxID=3156264 RepID=UPI00351917E4